MTTEATSATWYTGDLQPLSHEAEQTLIRRYKETGDLTARNMVVRCNLRFVAQRVRLYGHTQIPFADLMGVGTMALYEALERYDLDMKTKFITYAVWWIRHGLQEAMVSMSGAVTILSAKRVRGKPQQEQYPHPQAPRFVRLDRPSSSAHVQLVDLPDPLASLHQDTLAAVTEDILATLSEQEAKIIRLHYGLGAEQPSTLAAIGRHLGLSREMVRQLRNRALAKLKTRCQRLGLSEDQLLFSSERDTQVVFQGA